MRKKQRRLKKWVAMFMKVHAPIIPRWSMVIKINKQGSKSMVHYRDWHEF